MTRQQLVVGVKSWTGGFCFCLFKWQVHHIKDGPVINCDNKVTPGSNALELFTYWKETVHECVTLWKPDCQLFPTIPDLDENMFIFQVCSLGINFLDKSAFSISLYVILNYILNQRMEMWLKSRLLTFIQEVESKTLTVLGLQSFLYAVPDFWKLKSNWSE